jgi:hypothetical protein
VGVSAIFAARIGGTSIGLYGDLSFTELDSHANMAVAGKGCTIIAKSGHYVNVSPFSADLSEMEKVEIVDVAIAYDNPISLVTYLLVMRNALLIPSMSHNLLPPFLIREASLFLDETPKFQSTDLSLDNHTIYDEETGMRIHLQLNGTLSYFPTRPLTLAEQENWDELPIVYLTPDSDRWDPQATHYGDAESSMLDNSGQLVDCDWTNLTIFGTADISGMQSEAYTWDLFDGKVDAIALDNEDWYLVGAPLDDDDEIRLTQDRIRAELANLSIVFEPALFSAAISNQAIISHISMSLGSTTADDSACEVFTSKCSINDLTSSLTLPVIASISAGRSQGVMPEHLSKIWRIPFDDAVKTLAMTTQLIQQSPDSLLSHSAGTNDRAVRYQKLRSKFFIDTMFATKKAKSLSGNTCCQVFVSDNDFFLYILCNRNQNTLLL